MDYEALKSFVREKQTSHPFAGFDHVIRVHDICLTLAEGIEVDGEILRAAAYLHDIAVPVFGPTGHNEKAREVVGDLLDRLGMSKQKQDAVFEAIRTHTRYTRVEPTSNEGWILRDADGVDYLGAVGIMRGVLRSFRNNSYDGNVTKGGAAALQTLIDKANSEPFHTPKAIALAKGRSDFIRTYIARLGQEIGGEI